MTQKEILELLQKKGGRLKRNFSFGKIAYTSMRKDNPVYVDVELRLLDNGRIEFAASGQIWNRVETDLYCAGQCLDEINEFVHNPKFKTIYKMWQKYHLNTMHAGTKEQEDFLESFFKTNNIRYDYTKACKVLEENNLYEVEHDGEPYKYGHGWLYEAIPDEDLTTIVNLLTEVK